MTQLGESRTPLLEAELTDQILGGFFAVYSEFGFGFLESNYANALAVELRHRKLEVAPEVPVELTYRGVPVGFYRYDMVINNRVLVEIKSTRALSEADERQLQNYLKASHIEVGLLLHFGPVPKPLRFIYTNDRKRRPV